MRRIKRRSVAVAIGLLGGAGLALAGNAPAAVGNYTYEPGGSCALPVLPSGVQTGLTNMGFETGNFSAWTVGREADDVSVTGADGFATPNEGRFMARLGSTYDSPDDNQPFGPNELCQDFTIDQPFESFAYRIFTWDNGEFDHFQYRVTVVNPATGEILAFGSGGGFGESGDLNDSGWQQVSVDLRGHVGETVRIYFEAGGSEDDQYPTWAYLDAIRDDSPKSIFLRAKPRKVKKGKRTNLIALVGPCPESVGDMVSFFRKNKQIGVVPTDGGCTAKMRVKIRKTTKFFATVPTDQQRAGATSNTVKVKVKKPQ
jgi:hypothetical protein